jgi:hypothetical protein
MNLQKCLVCAQTTHRKISPHNSKSKAPLKMKRDRAYQSMR